MSAKKQVVKKIEDEFPGFVIEEFPYRARQRHLIVSNPANGKKLRIRVGESRNYLEEPGVVNEAFRPYLQYVGWWTFEPSEIDATSADLWILIWPGKEVPTCSLLLPYADLSYLLFRCCTTRPSGTKDFYWYHPNGNSIEKKAFASRPLGTQGIKDVLEGVTPLAFSLSLSTYVDAWQKYLGDVLS